MTGSEGCIADDKPQTATPARTIRASLDVMPREYTRRIMKQRFACALILLAVTMVTTSFDTAAAVQNKGRYKKQGDACLWDPNDSGPNQCTPVWGKGRFKKEGDRCVWNASDSGADQCRPANGRFKKEGDRCVWNATDSGPDQCDPRPAK